MTPSTHPHVKPSNTHIYIYIYIRIYNICSWCNVICMLCVCTITAMGPRDRNSTPILYQPPVSGKGGQTPTNTSSSNTNGNGNHYATTSSNNTAAGGNFNTSSSPSTPAPSMTNHIPSSSPYNAPAATGTTTAAPINAPYPQYQSPQQPPQSLLGSVATGGGAYSQPSSAAKNTPTRAIGSNPGASPMNNPVMQSAFKSPSLNPANSPRSGSSAFKGGKYYALTPLSFTYIIAHICFSAHSSAFKHIPALT